MQVDVHRVSRNTDKDRLTISSVLKTVLALKELASGVVPLTDPTGIQRGLRAQHLVTTYSLHTHIHTQEKKKEKKKKTQVQSMLKETGLRGCRFK